MAARALALFLSLLIAVGCDGECPLPLDSAGAACPYEPWLTQRRNCQQKLINVVCKDEITTKDEFLACQYALQSNIHDEQYCQDNIEENDHPVFCRCDEPEFYGELECRCNNIQQTTPEPPDGELIKACAPIAFEQASNKGNLFCISDSAMNACPLADGSGLVGCPSTIKKQVFDLDFQAENPPIKMYYATIRYMRPEWTMLTNGDQYSLVFVIWFFEMKGTNELSDLRDADFPWRSNLDGPKIQGHEVNAESVTSDAFSVAVSKADSGGNSVGPFVENISGRIIGDPSNTSRYAFISDKSLSELIDPQPNDMLGLKVDITGDLSQGNAIVDTVGLPLDGNRDGQPCGNESLLLAPLFM